MGAVQLPARATLLPRLHEAHDRDGFLSAPAVEAIAQAVQLPAAQAWEAATSYPDFAFDHAPQGEPICMGLSCVLRGARVGPGQRAVHCQFRCYEAPAPGCDAPFPESFIRLAGPLLAPDDHTDAAGLPRARAMPRGDGLALVEASGLRGRGGAYFPTGRKWRAALDEGRPIALVVNAEEGEPGVFKDRAILGLRPRRFLEGLAIARHVLDAAVTVIFLNGLARAALQALEAALAASHDLWPEPPLVVRGGGGYVLGEETTLINALEGRKPVPRLRPPYPVEAGLFGMPTVVNNVETITNLAVLFRGGVEAFRAHGTPEASGTKLISLSGQVVRPGLYEVDLGTPLAAVIDAAGGPLDGRLQAVLAGGPSGGFLPAELVERPLLPGLLHPTGAVTGSGNMVVLDGTADLRGAVLAMAAFNAEESCGKCTPCREGSPRLYDLLAQGELAPIDDLLEVVNLASLCGLGQMAPGPVRSALHFWPGLFA